MSGSNYGGFEKICKLGISITSNDEQIITKAGDVIISISEMTEEACHDKW